MVNKRDFKMSKYYFLFFGLIFIIGMSILVFTKDPIREFLENKKEAEECGLTCQLGNLRSSMLAMGAKMDTLNMGQDDQDKKIKTNTEEMVALQDRIKKEEDELNKSLGNPSSNDNSGGHVTKHLGEKGGVIHPESFVNYV